MIIRAQKGLTFDDVLLAPRRSPVASRQHVDTSTWLTNNIQLNAPILSANMDTVTEAAMAIAMAQAGGIGILHRFMTVEQQVRQVRKVKRAQGFMVENPYTIAHDASLAEAQQLMDQHGVGGLVVINGDAKRLVGLITRRDLLLAPAGLHTVAEVMTPAARVVSVGPSVTSDEARTILYQHRLEKLPVVSSEGAVLGLITSRDVAKSEHHSNAALDGKGRLRVGAAIGVSARELARAVALTEAGADVLVLDIAHGHADHCIDMVRQLRQELPAAQIVAGNVATRDGARELVAAGADAIKVGIGPGSICTTRIVTGFGVPQLTAIMDSVAGVADAGRTVPVIADGGIKTSGDLVKALAAGASAVMIGSLFAGCEEAPGSPVIRDGQKVKVVRGMASLGAAIGRRAAERGQDESAEDQEDWDKVVPEGVEAVVPYRGNVAEIIYQLVGGLRSGLSYGGARTIPELQANAEFIEITAAGVRESQSHDVRKI
ncbi:MAG: IMP dehydrogenase [Caldilineaceae bacterium]|nr:IMP dehydrogenase [Caldilineaceae bacterium]